MAEQTAVQQNTVTRPPVVVVLGHVDHGKSSLLEAIKEDFHITKKESGGITQHIGAYQVEYQGKSITFIDTPGHEAFSAMRSRGAKVADIAVLVVAADEGIKPQTKEAIEQIQKAQLPLLVAINKIDRPEANPEKVKQELAQHDVAVETYGGSVPSVQTSATTKQGITEFLDMILLLAEMEDLKVQSKGPARGVVIDAHVDAQRGPAATLLIKEGELGVRDIVGTSSATGKVKIMEDFQGGGVKKAGPSMPVVVLGFENTPKVGEEFQVFPDIKTAQGKRTIKEVQAQRELKEDENIVPVIVKVDVAGSLEAVREVLERLPQEKISLKVVSSGVGDIGENDVKLAKGTGARILGFHVKASAGVASLADREDVRIETFEIIYELEKRAKELLEKSLEPEVVRKDLGALQILAVFRTEKNRQIVGGKVMEGEIQKGSKVEIVRNEEIIGKGKTINLQRNKKDVGSVSKGEEAGLIFEGDQKLQEDDILRFFIEEKQKQVL